MDYQGNILKMRTELGDPIRYFLPVGEQEIDMNALLGKPVRFQFDGQINCIACGKKTKTSFGQGFCYSCFQTVPEASETVMRPELSKAQFGIARDMDWANEHDLIDHFVYLAVITSYSIHYTKLYELSGCSSHRPLRRNTSLLARKHLPKTYCLSLVFRVFQLLLRAFPFLSLPLAVLRSRNPACCGNAPSA